MEKICGIYKIENTINNKKYIGQSINILRRWQEHKRQSTWKKNMPLYKSFEKYGIENFTFDIIEICDSKLLNARETFYISKYKTNNSEYGYNIQGGGYNCRILDPVRKKEVGDKIRKYKIGTKMDEKLKERLINMHKGMHYPPEINKKKGRPGKKLSESTKKKISEKAKERMDINGCKKPVRCIETNQIWSCIEDAEKETKDQVSRCCRGIQLNSNGKHYEFINEKDKEEFSEIILKLKKNHLRSINSIICENNGMWFKSANQASAFFNIDKSIILKSARNNIYVKNKQYKFRFLMEEDYDIIAKEKLL